MAPSPPMVAVRRLRCWHGVANMYSFRCPRQRKKCGAAGGAALSCNSAGAVAFSNKTSTMVRAPVVCEIVLQHWGRIYFPAGVAEFKLGASLREAFPSSSCTRTHAMQMTPSSSSPHGMITIASSPRDDSDIQSHQCTPSGLSLIEASFPHLSHVTGISFSLFAPSHQSRLFNHAPNPAVQRTPCRRR